MLFRDDAFKGKVFGVTGGGRGIGHAIVNALLASGAEVLAISLDAPTLDRSISEQSGDRLQLVAGDVADEAMMARAIFDTVDRFGRLDGWVNNAMFNHAEYIEAQPEAAFRKTWEVNLLAAWRAARLCLPHFRRVGGGTIVNVGSVMSQLTCPQQAAYTSSKAALEGLTRALAVELAQDHVRVNAVIPGYVLTYSGLPQSDDERATWTESQRLQAEIGKLVNTHTAPWPEAGQAQDIAGPVLFLLSNAARFITGASLVADGGLTVALRDLGDFRCAEVAQRICALKKRQDALQPQNNGRPMVKRS